MKPQGYRETNLRLAVLTVLGDCPSNPMFRWAVVHASLKRTSRSKKSFQYCNGARVLIDPRPVYCSQFGLTAPDWQHSKQRQSLKGKSHMKTSKIQETDKAVLETQQINARVEYDSGVIEFSNSKGVTRTLAYARIDRNGGFIGDRETDRGAWDDFVACSFKAQHEQKRSVMKGSKLTVKAGHSIKQGSAWCAFRTSKMVAAKAEVTVQLAHAQGLARTLDRIQAELDRRNEVEKLKAEELAKKAQDASVLASMLGVTEKAA